MTHQLVIEGGSFPIWLMAMLKQAKEKENLFGPLANMPHPGLAGAALQASADCTGLRPVDPSSNNGR